MILERGITLRQAAMVVLFGVLISTFGTPIAEFVIWPTLVIPGNIEETVRNIRADEGKFLAATFAYLVGFAGDVLVAWALYVLLLPVNRHLSMLSAWVRVVSAVVSIGGALNLVTAFRLLDSPEIETALGSDRLHAQVLLLLNSFRYEWGMALVLFGIHLGLLGYLVYRSGYIPRLVGIALGIAGIGYVVYNLGPYLYPDADLEFVYVAFFGELVFLVWLAIRGWRIQEPAGAPTR